MLLGRIAVESKEAMPVAWCGPEKLRDAFNLPVKVRRLWVSFHSDDDEEYRIPGTITLNKNYPECYARVPGERAFWHLECVLFDGLFESIGKRECFVQVEYEE